MKKLQVHKLRDSRVKNIFQVMLEERLHCVTTAEPVEQWKQMKTILQETTAEVVGLSTRKHQHWFDEADKDIQELLEKKRSCHNHLLAKLDDQAAKAAYKTACSTFQAKLRTMQNDWWTGLAERTQRYADMGDMRAVYEALRRPSVDPHIRSKTLYALRMEVPCWQTRKPFSSAVKSISRASSVTEALCRSLHWPRFPKWT